MALTEKNLLLADHRGDRLYGDLQPLEWAGYTLRVTRSLRETVAALSESTYDAVVIAPLVESGRVELETLDRLRAERGLPVLVVTCNQGVGPSIAAAAALHQGPWDLIHAGAPVEEVLMRVSRLARDAASHGELEELRWRAHHDERTGLLRPDVFAARLQEHFSAAQRHHMNLALVLVDLDRFGAINKEFDHTVGDAVIASVGEAIRGQRRAEDVAARLGGDEFALVLPYTRRVEAALVVRRLCREVRALSHMAPAEFRGTEEAPRRVEVSASVGFETYDGSDLQSPEVLRRHAEIALRESKLGGGNQALYYRSLNERSLDDPSPLYPSAVG